MKKKKKVIKILNLREYYYFIDNNIYTTIRLVRWIDMIQLAGVSAEWQRPKPRLQGAISLWRKGVA